MAKIKNDISIVLGGAAGQGIQTIEEILSFSLRASGYHLFATKDYMSRVRGGINTTEIRISSHSVRAFVSRIDILIPFIKGVLSWVQDRLSDETVVIGEKVNIEHSFLEKINLVEVPLTSMAKEAGGALFTNTLSGGLILGLFKAELKPAEIYLKERFSSKGSDVVDKNITALKRGYQIGMELSDQLEISVERDEKVKENILLSGTEAIGIGALAGGMNFLSFYPMSPSTGVSTFAAHNAEEFGIVVEQVEDEIAAINMAIGAWFAGARAMVSTSGGGFALMSEVLSLAGMAENPVVIHLAQRPGPATGLPTRTMQGDLNLVLYSGHGDFPRIVLAPGDIKEAIFLTAEAFNLADRFQVPVIILTDEYFVDSYYDIPFPDIKAINFKQHIVKSPRDYKRYALTEDGISPRAIPGYGEGIVIANGNEHDEFGDTTEDADLTNIMQEKRAHKKLSTIRKVATSPKVSGNSNAEVTLVSWGSTYHIVEEALKDFDDISHVHFSWIYPLNPEVVNILSNRRIIAVENNVTPHFANLLKTMGVKIDGAILKYDGRPFSVEYLKEAIKEVLK